MACVRHNVWAAREFGRPEWADGFNEQQVAAQSRWRVRRVAGSAGLPDASAVLLVRCRGTAREAHVEGGRTSSSILRGARREH